MVTVYWVYWALYTGTWSNPKRENPLIWLR